MSMIREEEEEEKQEEPKRESSEQKEIEFKKAKKVKESLLSDGSSVGDLEDY